MRANAQEVPTYSHEENVKWWTKLGETRQNAIYASALHSFPYLANHMEYNQTALSAPNFKDTVVFKLMMGILNR